ncbi:MAG: asparagine synthetase B, partial [Firmicutes bacterium]|nr:asparagine synthetase B [Bacillota bacterium]
MSGICGYFGKNLARRSLPRESLAHRGPDSWNEVWGDGFGLGCAHFSLRHPDEDRQPVCNEDQTIWLVCDGRIYNHHALREELVRRHSFRTDTAAEVIVHLLEEEGPDGLRRLDGMFALAAFLPGGAILARDPLGIKPLYFRTEGEDCFFASELKAFPGDKGNVRELPAGCLYRLGIGLQPYYELAREYRRDLDRMTIHSELRRRLHEAVTKMHSPDVATGVFLSGGLDSALVAAIAARGQSELHTFSVGCGESPDRHYARLVAEHLGSHHHEYTLEAEQMWEALPEVIYHLESYDYALVRSAVANFFLARFARDFAKVVLVGEGADELFGGYAYLDRFTDWDDLHRELREITAGLYNTGLQRVDRMSAAHGLEARLPFLDTKLVDFS